MTEQDSAAPRRSRRRNKRRKAGDTPLALEQLPWGQLRYIDPPTEPVNAEGVARIHDAAMRILEDIGIEFLHVEAKQVLKAAGCTVDPDSDNVRMDRGFVMEQVAKAPSSFTITPRNPDHRVVIGDGHAAFGQVASPPNVSDLDNGRRGGNRQDFQNLLKLAQSFNCIHLICGYPVEPIDIHASIRHLDAIFDLLTLTDKAMQPYPLGKERIEDAMEMVRIAGGLNWEEFKATPRMFTNINSSSPLKHDWPMLDGAMRMARHKQPVIVTPFTLSGAMAPITIAGAVAQQTAEALAAIALLQVVQPGTPVVYGSFTSNVDMKTGAPAFGTPEYMRATQMSGQMARRYNLPMRVSNANASNVPDAQATWESVYSLQAASMAHGNIVYHAAGWLEGGLCASFEKFIIDCELLQQLTYYHQPVSVTDDDLAVETIKEVGPNGHFLGCAHTQQRYKTAFYSPFLSDWSNFEQWEQNGSVTATQRANRIWKQVLEEYQPPKMDPAIREELESFVERRKREGGAPMDF
ncbi:MAG: Glycine betaine methyltransferase [Gammaproteobacteria bacterium]|nr:Glycine betaine methyltransferase [Gammaproteobacteria bacterium]